MEQTQLFRNTKIVFFAGGLGSVGGAERQAMHLASYLKSHHGAQVEYWGVDTPGAVCEECDSLNIPWRQIPLTWSYSRKHRIQTIFTFARALRKHRVDILSTHVLFPNVVGGLAWKLGGCKAHLWNQEDEGLTWAHLGRWERHAAQSCTHAIAKTRTCYPFLNETLGVPQHRTVTIPNAFIPPKSYSTPLELPSPSSSNQVPFRAAMVANLSKFKDHATLVRAWRLVVFQLQQSHPHLCPQLFFAGALGETAQELKALCFDLGLQGHVFFLGAVQNVASLLEQVDLSLLSTPSETFSLALMEYMSKGKPFFASNIPALAEVVGEGAEHVLVSHGNPEAWSQRILSHVEQPDALQAFWKEKQERVLHDLNEERIFSRYLPLLQAIER